jgi:hypothetical protein
MAVSPAAVWATAVFPSPVGAVGEQVRPLGHAHPGILEEHLLSPADNRVGEEARGMPLRAVPVYLAGFHGRNEGRGASSWLSLMVIFVDEEIIDRTTMFSPLTTSPSLPRVGEKDYHH